jgi:hypothetical protein
MNGLIEGCRSEGRTMDMLNMAWNVVDARNGGTALQRQKVGRWVAIAAAAVLLLLVRAVLAFQAVVRGLVPVEAAREVVVAALADRGLHEACRVQGSPATPAPSLGVAGAR